MESHELSSATVMYYNRDTGQEEEVIMYFRFLPRHDDILTIHCYTEDDDFIKSIHVRVNTIEHIAENRRRVEPDIIIKTESV